MATALCILAAGKTTVLAATLFSLSWTHSVQKTEWQEDWVITPAGLVLQEARVKGSGAGMEPPEDAVLKNGWWTYRPAVPAQERLALASSGATASGWHLCASGTCLELGTRGEGPIEISACALRE